MSLAVLQWAVEALLLVALAAALPAAFRLERALAALKRDRGQLSDSARGFAEATREAEAAIARLRATADGAGRSVAEQVRIASALREDLRFLTERAEQMAERLDSGVRTARPAADPALAAAAPLPRARAEADLLRALRRGRGE
ncbi:DUF6468 domain-containing protein [Falsiroseomonas sp. CW058]|uniref:DUF6468 domain-containing protein n=1 Tax=Falsiroseomonas sp. CW058 TaxID=3388664 RepID=UPI003D321307